MTFRLSIVNDFYVHYYTTFHFGFSCSSSLGLHPEQQRLVFHAMLLFGFGFEFAILFMASFVPYFIFKEFELWVLLLYPPLSFISLFRPSPPLNRLFECRNLVVIIFLPLFLISIHVAYSRILFFVAYFQGSIL